MKMPDKPVRVATGTVHLFDCPVCREAVMGTVEVEAHLGDLNLSIRPATDPAPSDAHRVQATMPVVTRARSMRVEHRCSPTEQAATS
jgi:hypothetical protein